MGPKGSFQAGGLLLHIYIMMISNLYNDGQKI